MEDTCTELWEKLSLALKPHVSPDTFKRWFSAVSLMHATDDTLTFSVPNNIYELWIESNHITALQSVITHVLGGPRGDQFSARARGSRELRPGRPVAVEELS